MPSTGADALEASNAILTALYKSRAALAQTISAITGIGAPQITVGLIEGGINTNVVPDRIVFRLDRRVIPDETMDNVEAGLIRDIKQAADLPGITVEIKRLLRAEPLVPSAGAARLTERLCARASERFGEPITVKGVPLYTDARHYAAAGVPIILYGAGPRTIEQANAHRADERLELVDLRRATEVIALTIFDMLR